MNDQIVSQNLVASQGNLSTATYSLSHTARPTVAPPEPPTSLNDSSEIPSPSFSTLSRVETDLEGISETANLLAESIDGVVPKRYQDAITCDDSAKWMDAIQLELEAHETN